MNEMKFDLTSYSSNQHNLQVSNVPSQRHPSFDASPNYHTERSHGFYPSSPIPAQTSMPVQTVAPPSSTNTHATLGPRYSGGSTCSNVLMLPPAHHPRGGSLPDLRTGNAFQPQQLSFSTTPSPPSSINRDFFRSSSPNDNGDPDLYILVLWQWFWKARSWTQPLSLLFQGSQQQFASNIGPLKQSPSIRRRHSPIGEGKQSSPRRQNSPTSDISSVNSFSLFASTENQYLLSFRTHKLSIAWSPPAPNRNPVTLLRTLRISWRVPAMIIALSPRSNLQITTPIINKDTSSYPAISTRLHW